MRILLILFLSTFAVQAQEILVYDNVNKNIIQGKYGDYSELNPILISDGSYALGVKCLNHPDLRDRTYVIRDVDTIPLGMTLSEALLFYADSRQNILPWPGVGGQINRDSIYKYNGLGIDDPSPGSIFLRSKRNTTLGAGDPYTMGNIFNLTGL